jgi:hypothetical protein
VPEPLTPVIAAPVTPVEVSTKSPAFTPVTFLEKFAVKLTLARFVGLRSTRVIPATTGGFITIGVNVAVLVAVGVEVCVAVLVGV